MPTPRSAHLVLRTLLSLLSLLAAAVGLLLIFSGKPLIARLFLQPPEAELSTLLLAMLKEMGGVLLMLSLLFYFASRDPARNVAIVDAAVAGLCVLAVTPFVSLYTLGMGQLYPGYLIWGRSLVRLLLAGLLYYLRPREQRELTRSS